MADAPIDLSIPAPDPSPEKKEEKVELGPLASAPAVFGKFGRTRKVSTLRFFGIVFSVISGCVYPLMAYYFAKSFEDLGGQPGSSGGDDYMEQVRQLVWVFLYLGAGGFVFLCGQAVCLEIAASDATTDLKVQWFEALLRQDMAYYDIKDISSQATIVAANANRFKRGVGRKLGEGIQFFITVIGGFAYAFVESWEVSLIILAVVPLMAGSGAFMLTVGTKQTERKNKNYAETGGIVYNTISAIRTVFSLNASEKMIDDFKVATKKAQDSAIGFTFWIGLANGGIMSSFLVSYIALTLYGSWKLYSQVRSEGCDSSNIMRDYTDVCAITGRQVFGALMGVSIGAMGLSQISGAAEAFNGSRAACHPALLAIERTVEGDAEKEEFRDEVPDVEEDADASSPEKKEEIPLPKYVIDASSEEGKKPSSVHGDITFQDLSFRYPTRKETLVFNGLSLTIRAGQTVALVGPSGSGKSTTVSLLERFYDPSSGSILLDGTDLRDLNIQWLRDQIGLVSQEPVLFARSIKENIAYGLPGATDEQIIAVAKSANAHDFISKFPQGYDTQVGDRGAQLSGGQKQRVAIARILLKNPKILLLDEATSALDSESEYIVQQALDDVVGSGDRTTIIIAHRLSTIRNADVIAVVKDGRIAEQGSHDQLMAMNSEYAKLVEAQAPKAASTASSVLPTSFNNLLSTSNYDAVEVVDSPQVQFKDVHFHYPSRPENGIFKGLNLSVKHGETLAIVGSSGGGKSTIIQMIERFYDPIEGSVEYEGTNLKDLNVKWLRDQLGLVSQEPTLFNTTIGENIKYGLQSATQQDVEDAAMKANAHDFIMSFPNGYNTSVGEGATQISGGQKQRIAIARAILKKPKILLFDEATSALDSQSEAVVQEAIDNLMETKNQTVIVIAHRLSTIRNADRIAVVGDGVIKEIGPHNYLMSKPDGQYRRLVEFNQIGGEKKKKKEIKDEDEEEKEEDGPKDTDSAVVEGELDKEQAKELSKRAKVLARSDFGLFFIGSVGAILAGLLYPGWGVVFAFMIELLYNPIFPCDDTALPFTNPREGDDSVFNSCQDYFDYEADYMKDFSLNVTYAWCGIIASGMIGNVLLFYGFGAATERMNKRVRDQIFVALMRQDVSYYDTHSLSNLSTKLEDDAAMMHSFSGEPIRQLTMTVASLVVGLVISFYYMWPFALLTLAILPFMSFGAYMEMKMYIGEDAAADEVMEGEDSSGSIVVETLTSIRTVASLSIERMRLNEYVRAINLESPSSLKSNALKGVASGLGVFIQFWGIGLMFWWGAYCLSTWEGAFTFRGFLISLNSLLFSLSGLSVAIMGATDSAKAKLAANRIFALIDRESPINSLSDSGKKIV